MTTGECALFSFSYWLGQGQGQRQLLLLGLEKSNHACATACHEYGEQTVSVVGWPPSHSSACIHSSQRHTDDLCSQGIHTLPNCNKEKDRNYTPDLYVKNKRHGESFFVIPVFILLIMNVTGSLVIPSKGSTKKKMLCHMSY